VTKILLFEPAEYDLLDIEYYIHTHLCNPQTVDHVVGSIINTIRRLKNFPKNIRT